MVENFEPQEEAKQTHNERGLETSFVNEALEDLFDDEKQCDGNFLYMWKESGDIHGGDENGAKYYDNAVKNEEYYKRVTLNEIKIFENNYEDLKRYIEDSSVKNIIELGPGADNKLIKLLLKKYNLGGKTYIPIDVATKFLEIAEAYVKKINLAKHPHEKIGFYREFQNRFDPEVYRRNHGTVFNVGGSIGNSKSEKNSELIRAMSNGPKRHILISYFNLPESDDEEEMQNHIDDTLKTYQTPEMEKRVMKGYEALGLDVSKLEFAVDYVKGEPDMIKMGAKVRKGESLTYQSGGKTLIKESGEALRAITSRRYKKEEFDGMVKAGGAKVIETYREGPLSLAVVETIPKTKRELMKEKWEGVSSRAKNALGALLLVAGSVGLTAVYQHQQEKHRYQQIAERGLDDLLSSWNPKYENNGRIMSLDKKREVLQKKREGLLECIENRYGNDLSEEQIGLITSYFYLWVKENRLKPAIVNINRYPGFIDSNGVISPTPYEEFMVDSKSLLQYMNINSCPNESLTQYKSQLRNSYRYVGEVLLYEEVDYAIGEYVSMSGKTSDMGVKTINGTEYVLFKNHHGLYELGESDVRNAEYNGSVIQDIIRRGELTTLANQVREYLNSKYSESGSLGGQKVILKYLTDLYADGFDLGYLLGTGYEKGYERKDLEEFIFSYLLPDVGEGLQSGATPGFSRMSLDFVRLKQDCEKSSCDLHAVAVDVIDFLESYTGKEDPGFQRSTESEILRLLIQTGAAKLIQNDDQMIRCWVTDHRDELNALGYNIQEFPTDEYLNSDISNDGQEHVWMGGKGGSLGGVGTYSFVDGSIMKVLSVSDPDNYGRLKYIAQKPWDTMAYDEMLERKINECIQEKDGDRRSVLYMYNDVIESDAVNELNNLYSYTSENMNEVIEDYIKRKKARERYNQLK